MAGRRPRHQTPFLLAPDVSRALETGAAVVALETAVLTHGLPQPVNFDLACNMEVAVRDEAAVPATIGAVEGHIRVGIPRPDLQRLAESQDCDKLGARDLAAAVVRKRSGGTTVGATMFVAARVGITVLATGGIGGLHRENPYDVSADLYGLATTPMIVVCSGAKSILNLPATLELLESMSVPVATYRADEFPSFYSRDSGLPAQLKFETPEEIAEYWTAMQRLGAAGALIVANPVPEAEAIPEAEIAPALSQASEEARKQSWGGKDLTPSLLHRVTELSGGRTLRANLALLLSNAHLAARIAVELSRREGRRERLV
ncbi:MAG: pseudouridine-5'-phosphate glycosidase [Anaerolineales bacterium]